jgi:hypothetical protein
MLPDGVEGEVEDEAGDCGGRLLSRIGEDLAVELEYMRYVLDGMVAWCDAVASRRAVEDQGSHWLLAEPVLGNNGKMRLTKSV